MTDTEIDQKIAAMRQGRRPGCGNGPRSGHWKTTNRSGGPERGAPEAAVRAALGNCGERCRGISADDSRTGTLPSLGIIRR